MANEFDRAGAPEGPGCAVCGRVLAPTDESEHRIRFIDSRSDAPPIALCDTHHVAAQRVRHLPEASALAALGQARMQQEERGHDPGFDLVLEPNGESDPDYQLLLSRGGEAEEGRMHVAGFVELVRAVLGMLEGDQRRDVLLWDDPPDRQELHLVRQDTDLLVHLAFTPDFGFHPLQYVASGRADVFDVASAVARESTRLRSVLASELGPPSRTLPRLLHLLGLGQGLAPTSEPGTDGLGPGTLLVPMDEHERRWARLRVDGSRLIAEGSAGPTGRLEQFLAQLDLPDLDRLTAVIDAVHTGRTGTRWHEPAGTSSVSVAIHLAEVEDGVEPALRLRTEVLLRATRDAQAALAAQERGRFADVTSSPRGRIERHRFVRTGPGTVQVLDPPGGPTSLTMALRGLSSLEHIEAVASGEDLVAPAATLAFVGDSAEIRYLSAPVQTLDAGELRSGLARLQTVLGPVR